MCQHMLKEENNSRAFADLFLLVFYVQSLFFNFLFYIGV